MKMKSFLPLVLMLTIQPAFADLDPAPTRCPDVQALKNVGVHDAIIDNRGWAAFSIDNFSTPQRWRFGISSMMEEAKDKNDAINKGNEYIGLLVLSIGPQKDRKGRWICEYEYHNHHPERFVMGFAYTPPSINENN